MSKLLISLVAVVALAGEALAQEPQRASTLEVLSANNMVLLEAPKQLTLKFWLQQLMLSALYRNVVQDSSLDEWQVQLSAPTRVHVRYPAVAILAIPERQTLSFEEVLLPLPSDRYPDYMFIRRGQQVHRLAKYDPWVLHKLVSEAGLRPYENLSAVERALF